MFLIVSKESYHEKILVAYYSRNGVTANVAEHIAAVVHGDTYRMTIDDDLPTFIPDAKPVALAKREANDICQLTNKVPDVSKYDLILVGGPVWNDGVANPVIRFLRDIADYQGKIAPFYTSIGAFCPCEYETDFKRLAGLIKVEKGLNCTVEPNMQEIGRWYTAL